MTWVADCELHAGILWTKSGTCLTLRRCKFLDLLRLEPPQFCSCSYVVCMPKYTSPRL